MYISVYLVEFSQTEYTAGAILVWGNLAVKVRIDLAMSTYINTQNILGNPEAQLRHPPSHFPMATTVLTVTV